MKDGKNPNSNKVHPIEGYDNEISVWRPWQYDGYKRKNHDEVRGKGE